MALVDFQVYCQCLGNLHRDIHQLLLEWFQHKTKTKVLVITLTNHRQSFYHQNLKYLNLADVKCRTMFVNKSWFVLQVLWLDEKVVQSFCKPIIKQRGAKPILVFNPHCKPLQMKTTLWMCLKCICLFFFYTSTYLNLGCLSNNSLIPA